MNIISLNQLTTIVERCRIESGWSARYHANIVANDVGNDD